MSAPPSAEPAPQPASAAETSTPLPDRAPRESVTEAEAPPPLPQKAPDKPAGLSIAKALAPLLDYQLSAPDLARLKESVRATYKGRFDDVRSNMTRIKDPAARKLAYWYYYRSTGLDAKAKNIEAFRLANPEWPGGRRMRENAERALLVNSEPAKDVKAFFAEAEPVTGAGKAALAAVHLKEGDRARAAMLVRSAWRDHGLTDEIEKEILKKFADLLTPEDHKARADALLYKDRKSKIGPAMRAADQLDKTERKKIEARAAVVQRTNKAIKLLDAIPADAAKDDVALTFSRIQWLRRKDKDEEAWALLEAAPLEPSLLIDLDEWWIERRINCRSALDAGKYELAYQFAKDHGPVSGGHYIDAEFLAGWIALRYLNKPEAALTHFLALRTAAIDTDDIARAEYWLGRTLAALGKAEEAADHFRNAGIHTLTYYGQLARQAINPEPADLPLPAPPVPTKADAERFQGRGAVRAIGAARTAGLEGLTPLFLFQLARTLTSAGELVLLAELARKMDQAHSSVRLAKIALNRGQPMADYAFPVDLLPEYKKLNDGVEPAFLFALSRQESEFNPGARSPAGARGLMQLMPRTARAVARQHNVRYRGVSRLTDDPSYNMMLGSAHLRDLIDDYDGSYIMALAAYNAGGHRVSQWSEAFGDPRKASVDPIDWVERIPFTETRLYVQKILSTLQIFRARLNGPEKAAQLWQDLHRGKNPAVPAAAAAIPAPSPQTRTSE